jgi:HlyD family secretion protein
MDNLAMPEQGLEAIPPASARHGLGVIWTRKRAILALLVVSAAAVLAERAWSGRTVAVAVVERGTALEAVYGTGTIEAVNRVAIKARVPGPIARLLVREGERVAEGDLLAWIDSPTLRHEVIRGESDVAAARGRANPQLSALRASQHVLEAQLAQARLDLRRAVESAKLGTSAQQDLERAKLQIALLQGQRAANRAQQDELAVLSHSDAQRAEAGLEAMRSRAGDAEARAPIAGVVLARYAELGEVVSVNQEVFRIGDIEHLQVEALVDEADVGRVRVGMLATVRVAAFAERSIKATVRQISAEAIRERRGFRVDLQLVDSVEGLRPGMSAECNIILAQHEGALLVPTDAAHGDHAWVVGPDETLQRRAIKPGLRDIGRIELTQGVAAGELVVVGDERGLVEGQKVRPSQGAPEQQER